jgi:hypothetical protein
MKNRIEKENRVRQGERRERRILTEESSLDEK